MKPLIYGKNSLDRIVCIEPGDSTATIFRETSEGEIVTEKVPNTHYILFTQQHSDKFRRLEGNQPFKYIYETNSREKYKEVLSACYKKRWDLHAIRDAKEALMIREGYTYFKGTKVDEVSVLSFDIETVGLAHNKDSKVLLISNTFRKRGEVVRKLFSVDEYASSAEMIQAWSKWVRAVDPSIIVGHNIFGYDLPYMQHCAGSLNLGRDNSPAVFAERTSQFRKDGSQSYDYNNVLVHGREIVDTFFLAMKYDIGRNYENYKLKDIVAHEGLEREGRQHYDAGQIAKDWADEEKRKKIKTYAIDDADDALKLWDLMIPSFFYYTQSVPRSLQAIINSATGSQVNSIMVRAYLQDGHSVAMGSDSVEYEGAISFGNPGIHKNVMRIDVASLYPSVMRQYKIHSPAKDPKGLFLQIVETFTLERLNNKKLGKETGDRYYKDLEQSQKIVINSAYGFLGAPKLNYNFPEGAAKVTEHGRRILTQVMDLLTSMNFVLVAGDTDGLAFKKADSKAFTPEERSTLVDMINARMDELIRWEDDGVVKKQIVIKTKNYILQDESGKVKIKGSALKATNKEKALQRFQGELIDLLLKDRKDRLYELYMKYVNEIVNLREVTDWSSKKTITKAVLSPERTNEQRVLDALKDADVNEGDKVYMFFKTETELCLRENFDGTFHMDTLLDKLHKSVEIFETVIDTEMIPSLTLKRNKDLLPAKPVVKSNPTVTPLFPPGFFQTRSKT